MQEKYDEVPNIITGKDLDYLKDMFNWNYEALKKANGRIKSDVLASTGWYKCPNFKFELDTSLEKSKNIEDLFAKIKKDKTKSEKE